MRTSTMKAPGRSSRALAIVLGAALATLLLAGPALAASHEGRAAAKPGKPTAKTPRGTVATQPTFTWGKAKRAKAYEVRVFKAGKQIARKAGLKKRTWKPSATLPTNVDLTWKVRGRNARGNGPWSKTLKFSVSVPEIGQSYGGGKVAYILQRGDPGYVAGVTHGLIAAPHDQEKTDFSNIQAALANASGTALGTGASNTAAIARQAGCSRGAAYACDRLVLNGYSDWFLPSKDELNKLYLNRVAIGNFGYEAYWSSSEGGATHAWTQYFVGGSQAPFSLKYYVFCVRAVRSF